MAGVVRALQGDLKRGYLQGAQELIHGELFADFLEMAAHLLEEGYKDAAAVIAGGALESHLRQLCQKVGVDPEYLNSGGVKKPKKADQMNTDLVKASAYGKGDLKTVTSWLDTRNSAAHGQYGDYKTEQIDIYIKGIRDFIVCQGARKLGH